MFNVYKNQLSLQTGSSILTGPKTLPTIWYTYMTLVTNIRFLPSTVTEKNATKNILDGRKDGRTGRQTDRGKTVCPPPPSGSRGIIIDKNRFFLVHPLLKDQKLAISPFNLSVINSPKQTTFGRLIVFAPFLIIIISILYYRNQARNN